MLNLKHIAKGWLKFFTKERPEYYRQRAFVCMDCPHSVDSLILHVVKNEALELPGKKCEVCGCALQAKLMLKEEKCPKDKWLQLKE